MMKSLFQKKNSFFTGHKRSVKAKKNIVASFGLRGLSIIVSFWMIPLTLDYLDPTKYGIWLTLSTIISWLDVFDIGLGNGLRNKLSEALAYNDEKLAKVYVSSTYALLAIVIGVFYVLFLILNQFLDWSIILNSTEEIGTELNFVILVVFTLFSVRFIFKLINVIFMAYQVPFYNNLVGFVGNFIALLWIVLITKFSSGGSLLLVSIAYSSSPVIVLFFVSVYFFKGKHGAIKPSVNYVDLKYFKPLVGVGSKFFILQLSGLILFSTDNVLISHLFGPSEVVPFTIASKYFGIPIMIFSLITVPFWSAFTEAMVKNDVAWIERTLTQLRKTWMLTVVLLVFIMLLISNYFYAFWVGEEVVVPLSLSFCMGIYAIIVSWNSIYSNFINGIGKIKLQMYYSLFAMILNVPLSIVLVKYFNFGVNGVLIGTIICLLFSTVLGPIQTHFILKGEKEGIWIK